MVQRFFWADRMFFGSGTPRRDWAFGVEDGVVTWVGPRISLPTRATYLGPLVMPGFIDAHIHPLLMAEYSSRVYCAPPECNSILDVIGSLHAWGLENATDSSDGDWILGHGYDESLISDGRSLTADDLDLVSRTRPIFVERSDCHSGYCNREALRRSGITRATPDPDGAYFERDEHGNPNGVLREIPALLAVKNHIPSASSDTVLGALTVVGKRLAALGLTTVTEMMARGADDTALRLYRQAADTGADGDLGVAGSFDQQALLYWTLNEVPDEQFAKIFHPLNLSGRIRVFGLKLFMDGAVSGRTAWVGLPYPGGGRGMRTCPDEVLERAWQVATTHGLQIAVHAMGDAAIRTVVDFFRNREPWLNPAPSVRIEHATMLTPQILDKMVESRMNFGIATNVNFLFAEYPAYRKHLSDTQLSQCYRLRDMYDSGLPLALTSDAPATTDAQAANPLVSIQAALTRQTRNGEYFEPDQALRLHEALELYTSRAAATLGIDAGVIKPGSRADFIALNRDLFSVEPDTIDQTLVEQTWIGGRLVYRRGQ